MPTGTVKWFNDAKGFGFIKGEDEKDYFVHMSEIKNGKINITKKTQTESSISNYVTTSIININNDSSDQQVNRK